MIPRELVSQPDYVYPTDEWRMVEKRFYQKFLAQAETLFSTANGYLGLRGSFEDGAPVFESGTFVNGFYESWPIVYGEDAFGFAKTGQTIVNVTDSKIIRLYVDDEPFYLPTAVLLHFERALDMRAGTLDRDVLWETPAGKQVQIKSRRLVSFEQRHLAAICYEVTVLNADAPVVISSEMAFDPTAQGNDADPRRHRGFRGRVLLPKVHSAHGHRLMLAHTTRNSKMSLACGVDHAIETQCPYKCESKCSEDSAKLVISVDAKPRQTIRIIKYMTYHTSRRAAPEELCERAERLLDRAQAEGCEKLLESQRKFLDDFWSRSDVEVRGDPAVQQAIRFNLFQIIQAAGRAEGAGIPAKGLTGQGYEGHYFWDIEIYVLPFLIYTYPRIAKNLLKFRHGFLDKARKRAREVNQKGALYPWRTINGDEASAYYAAGTAQYHINADIIYALKKYVDVTGDQEFLYEVGAEMLAETARLWLDLGFHSKGTDGQFRIHGVTGPDEYNTVVNNNAYTNLMARMNLSYAAATLRSLRRERPERYEALAREIGLKEAEIAQWEKAAEKMRIPFDEKLEIHPQDDNFLLKEPWDFDNTSKDRYPLLLHYHPLVIYRHRVVKQADVVLAMFLLGHEFSLDQKRRNFDYYDPLTTGDSSLSMCIQSIVACEVMRYEKAMEYGRYAMLMDLADIGGNVKDGCHIASMGGTWMAIVYGLAGMRDHDGQLSFRPVIAPNMERVRFPLRVRDQILDVEIAQDSATYSVREGAGLSLRHRDQEVHVKPGAPVTLPLAPRSESASP